MGNFIRRFGLPVLKLSVLALVVWGGHRTIAAGLTDLRQNGWRPSQLHPAWAVLAGLLYLLSQYPSGWFWHCVLIALGQRIPRWHALRAYYIGHLGKYFPGKALVIALRAALVSRPYCKISLAVVAVFYETFTTMAVGGVVAAMILLFTHREQTWLIVGALGLAVLVGLPTLPVVFVRLMRLLRMLPLERTASEAISSDSNAAASFIHPSAKLLLCGWSTIAIGWIFAGASLWAVLRAIGVENMNLLTDLPLDTATVSLAVVLGFVSMLPAGVGVRDVVLLQLLAPRLEQLMPQQGQLLALVAVIVLRLVWLAAEAALAAAIYPLTKAGKTAKP
ncbi:MAG TPA: lysylphosphatidylglycerol synthase transmembrane domain-containing protein [Pirellulales bacterium]|nr:lysylphosphatidylglycerol synthase transmembrane domain-containing protein [Pirellulales bacterium]